MNGSAWSYEDAVKTANTPQGPRAMPVTAPRNVLGPLAVDTPDMNSDPLAAASPWNRENPHATLNNTKTSQYIDKITSENERLRRELRAEKLAREDEAKRVSAARSKAEDSRAEHQHLQVLADANARAIERKDRKLEELKAALEAEVERRQSAERRAEEALKMLGDTRSETQRQLASAYEMKHHAEATLEATKDGYKSKETRIEKQLKDLVDQVRILQRDRNEVADKVKRHAIVSEQLQHEVTRTLRTEGRMKSKMEQYKAEYRKELDGLVTEAHHMRITLPAKEKEAVALVESLKATEAKMKWVMAQKKRQEGA